MARIYVLDMEVKILGLAVPVELAESRALGMSQTAMQPFEQPAARLPDDMMLANNVL